MDQSIPFPSFYESVRWTEVFLFIHSTRLQSVCVCVCGGGGGGGGVFLFPRYETVRWEKISSVRWKKYYFSFVQRDYKVNKKYSCFRLL